MKSVFGRPVTPEAFCAKRAVAANLAAPISLFTDSINNCDRSLRGLRKENRKGIHVSAALRKRDGGVGGRECVNIICVP